MLLIRVITMLSVAGTLVDCRGNGGNISIILYILNFYIDWSPMIKWLYSKYFVLERVISIPELAIMFSNCSGSSKPSLLKFKHRYSKNTAQINNIPEIKDDSGKIKFVYAHHLKHVFWIIHVKSIFHLKSNSIFIQFRRMYMWKMWIWTSPMQIFSRFSLQKG